MANADRYPMYALQFTARYQVDGMWESSVHVAYFATEQDRAAFAALPFVQSYANDPHVSDEAFYD